METKELSIFIRIRNGGLLELGSRNNNYPCDNLSPTPPSSPYDVAPMLPCTHPPTQTTITYEQGQGKREERQEETPHHQRVSGNGTSLPEKVPKKKHNSLIFRGCLKRYQFRFSPSSLPPKAQIIVIISSHPRGRKKKNNLSVPANYQIPKSKHTLSVKSKKKDKTRRQYRQPRRTNPLADRRRHIPSIPSVRPSARKRRKRKQK